MHATMNFWCKEKSVKKRRGEKSVNGIDTNWIDQLVKFLVKQSQLTNEGKQLILRKKN